jgi:hypothetical protein
VAVGENPETRMNAAHFTDPTATDLMGARAILVVPDPGSPGGGLLLMADDPGAAAHGHGVRSPQAAGPIPSEGMPTARTAVLREAVESGLRDRWTRVREAFADDPRGGVRDADALLQDVAAAFAEAIEEHRARLAAEWQVGRPGADRLRDALRQYDGLVGVLLGQS